VFFWLFLVIFGYFWLFLVIFGYFGNPRMGNLTDVVFYTHRANSFFVNDVLMRSDDLSDGVGPMLWWLVLGLTLTWVACFLCVMRGAESAGKAVWITMPLPYLMLFVLLFKGMSLAGSGTGVKFYLGQLDLHALGKGEAWIDAIAQIFFGLSICCGAMPVSVLHSRTVSLPYPII
jgi:SNF family Na+-dependent transporter